MSEKLFDKQDRKAIQSPAIQYFSQPERGGTLNDWYLKVIEQYKDQLLPISKHIVTDAYFSKHSFTQELHDLGFHPVSRLRDDSNLLYLYQGEKTGKKRRPNTFNGKIGVNNLYYRRMEKRDIYEEGTHKFYFSIDIEISRKDVIQFYRTKFQVEFYFRDSKQFTGLCHSQARDIICIQCNNEHRQCSKGHDERDWNTIFDGNT